MGKVWLMALAGLLALPAWATNTNTPLTISQISARNVQAKWGVEAMLNDFWKDVAAPRTVAAAVTPAGSVVLTSNYKGPSPKPGEVIDLAVKRTVPWAAIAKASSKALPLIGTALAIKDLMDSIRCREAMGGGGECDDGQNEVTGNEYRGYSTDAWVGSASVACANAFATYKAAPAPNTYLRTGGTSSVSGTHPSITCSMTGFLEQSWTSFKCGGGGTGWSCGTIVSNSITLGTRTGLVCPSVVVNGVTLVPVKGVDGKCPTNIFTPAPQAEIEQKGTDYGDKTKAPLIVGDLVNNGKPIDHPFPTIDPVPDSIIGPRETTSHPDGSTTVRDTIWDVAPTADGYEWVPRVVTKDYAPGATIPPPGSVTDGTTTTGSAPKEDPITCGLPTTPPCKIDETGTPTTPADDSATKVNGLMAGLLACITTPSSCLPALPDMNWSFALPTSCAPIPLPGKLGEWMEGGVDICPYQPVIHDIMGMLWAAAGLFGAISIMFKGSK